MIESVVGAVAGVKGAMDIAKGLQTALSKIELAEVRINLMERLGEAQVAIAQAAEDLQACRARVRTLEAENMELKAFDADIENYELQDTGRGALAYFPKGATPTPESGRWLCPNCLTDRKKSLLIPREESYSKGLKCHRCGWAARTGDLPIAL